MLVKALGFVVLGIGTLRAGLLIRWVIHKKRQGEPCHVDYMLTQHRIVALQPKAELYEQAELDRIVSMTRQGNSITFGVINPKDEYILSDLTDAVTAETVITKTLGPLS